MDGLEEERGMIMMRVVSFKVDDELLTVLEEIARRKNITKSEVIRRALRRYIDELDRDKKPFVTRRMIVF